MIIITSLIISAIICFIAAIKYIIKHIPKKTLSQEDKMRKWIRFKKRAQREAEMNKSWDRMFIDTQLKDVDKRLPIFVSENLSDYVTNNYKFQRKNLTDARYLYRWRASLFYLYGYRCPICQAKCTDLDHFFIPKISGGNLVMKRKDGQVVNNAVPLCSKCNGHKSTKHFYTIVTTEQLLYILRRNTVMSALIQLHGAPKLRDKVARLKDKLPF